jgi:hypothetical protein
MGKYKIASNEAGCTDKDGATEESDYEDDDGHHHTPDQALLGKGTYAMARACRSETATQSVVVLRSVEQLPPSKELSNSSVKEAGEKLEFFQAVYPQQRSALFWFESLSKKRHGYYDYRLVLPHLPGVKYKALIRGRNSFRRFESRRVALFISAVNALIQVHKQGFVVLDLQEENILIDLSNMVSRMIDGGIAVKVGKPVPHFAQVEMKKFAQLAPELSSAGMMGAFSMDIYSLGVMLRKIVVKGDSEFIDELLLRCVAQTPADRPTTDELLEELQAYNAELMSYTHLRFLKADEEIPHLPTGEHGVYFLTESCCFYHVNCWTGQQTRLPMLPVTDYAQVIKDVLVKAPLNDHHLAKLNAYTGYPQEPNQLCILAGDEFFGHRDLVLMNPQKYQVDVLHSAWKRPPIYFAVTAGSLASFLFLIERGAKVDLPDTNLFYCAKNSQRAEVLNYLAAHPELIAAFKDGTTDLHVTAVMNKQVTDEVWQTLISKADEGIELRDKYGRTPVFYHALYWLNNRPDHLSFPKILADDWHRGLAEGHFRQAIYFLSAREGDKFCAHGLQAGRALDSIQDKTVDDTLLHATLDLAYAQFNNNTRQITDEKDCLQQAFKRCEALLTDAPQNQKVGAFAGVYSYLIGKRNRSVTSSLDLFGLGYGHAAMKGLCHVISEWSNYDIPGINATPSLFYAARYEHVETVALLIRSGASLDKKHVDYNSIYNNNTAMCCAARQGSHEIITLLLDAGAVVSTSPDAQPIHFAASEGKLKSVGHLACLKIMIEKYPYLLEQLDSNNRTPLQVAQEAGHNDRAVYLQEQRCVYSKKIVTDSNAAAACPPDDDSSDSSFASRHQWP